MIVILCRDAHSGERIGIPLVIENGERRRFDEVRRNAQQDFAFAPRLFNEREIAFDEIPKTAVDELGGGAAGAVGEVALLN